MIVNVIDYEKPDFDGEGQVVPVRALFCAECQRQHATVYRFWLALVVLSVLAVLGIAIVSAIFR